MEEISPNITLISLKAFFGFCVFPLPALDVRMRVQIRAADEMGGGMNRKAVTGIMLTLLLISMLTVTFDIISVEGLPAVVNVPGDYPTIQAAINAANPGDLINVSSGTYYEHVVVNKSVSLIGEDRRNTIIDGSGTGNVINVMANNVYIGGFKIRNSGPCSYSDSGIYLYYSSHGNNISHNILTNNSIGIFVYASNNNTFINNNVSLNQYQGIYLWQGQYNSIIGNSISKNGWGGIFLAGSENITIADNIVSSHWPSCGIYLSGGKNNIITSNVASNNLYGIILDLSKNNILIGNNASNNHWAGIKLSTQPTYPAGNNVLIGNIASNTPEGGDGIQIYFSSDNILTSNVVSSNNRNGIALFGSNNNILTNNIASLNNYGIRLEYAGEFALGYFSKNNTLSGNEVSSNNYGVFMHYSSNNTLTGNVISNNGYNFVIFGGLNFSDYNNHIDTSNAVDGKPIYYLMDVANAIYDAETNAGTIYLFNSNNITIKDLTLTKNGAGVFFFNTTNSKIENVTTSNNLIGIRLCYSSNNTITGNIFSSNTHGIWILRYSNNNTIFHNNFIRGEGEQAGDEGLIQSTNIWDQGYPSGGNYWSDYTGVDLYSGTYQNETGSDDIGDTPYIINANNEDRYPLIRPWPWAHDIAILNVTPSKIVIETGHSLSINVTVKNEGDYSGTFNVTAYYDSTAIETQTILNLAPNANATLTFNWNTTGIPPGEYVISAKATILLGETDIDDNSFIDGTIYIFSPITPIIIHRGCNDYPINIESNITITKVVPTGSTFHFWASGPEGETGYINVTLDQSLVKDEIKVFIDGKGVTPEISTNGTHYFIYVTFTLSTHEIMVQYAIADIATTNIAPHKTAVGQGYAIRINTTIQNQGHYEENFNVTLYANATIIATITNITLTSGNSTTITFTWNTAGVPYGNYTITAKATPLPGETDTTDNTITNGWVLVTVPGDVNGDGECNILDIKRVKLALSGWIVEPNADLDNNGEINILDLKKVKLIYSGFIV